MNTTLRYLQGIMVIYIAMFFTLVAINNITDPDANLVAVRHIMSMDTTFKSSGVYWRAITNNSLQYSAFVMIVVLESITAILCWIGGIRLLISAKHQNSDDTTAKNISYVGLFIGLSLYLFGFIVIAGEWFCMWQSTEWNFQAIAGLIASIILFIMLFLSCS